MYQHDATRIIGKVDIIIIFIMNLNERIIPNPLVAMVKLIISGAKKKKS